MLLRISLILAILAGAGTIVVTQMMARKQIEGVITERNDHIKKENEERSGRKKAETALMNTSNQLVTTKETLAKTESDLNNTKQQLATAEARVQKLDADLAAAVNKRKDAEAQLQNWNQTGLTPQQAVALKSDVKKAQDAIAALEDEKKILTRNRDEWRNKYMTVIGTEDYAPELPAGTKGKVVAVDPKWNFVVLNIGKDKGLLERGILLIHRESKFIGKVRIAEVMENRSIASLMPGTTLTEVQEGDQVMY